MATEKKGEVKVETRLKYGYEVTDLGLAAEGKKRIEWAEREMPVLRLIRERFWR
jgi:S-adenosylhomocysteine hydrolase